MKIDNPMTIDACWAPSRRDEEPRYIPTHELDEWLAEERNFAAVWEHIDAEGTVRDALACGKDYVANLGHSLRLMLREKAERMILASEGW